MRLAGAAGVARLGGSVAPAARSAATVARPALTPAQVDAIIARNIAHGHAFTKHVLDGGEFPGITTQAGFAARILQVMQKATLERGGTKALSDGGTAFHHAGTTVIHNPAAVDSGTAFRDVGARFFRDSAT